MQLQRTYKQKASRHHLQKNNGGSGSTVLAYKPIILSVSTYSSFGAPLEDGSTNWSNESYRYGFNGMEKDDEIKGAGNSYDFGARIYDPRLGYFLSIDPLTRKYASQSPYVYAANSPLRYIDLHGMGPADAAKSGMSAAVAAASKKSDQTSNSGSGNANAKQPKSATQWVKTIATTANQKSQTASNNTASNNTANNSSGNSSQSLSQRVTDIVTEGSANQQSSNEQPGAGPIQSDESNQTESKEAVITNPISSDVSAALTIGTTIYGQAFDAAATGAKDTKYWSSIPESKLIPPSNKITYMESFASRFNIAAGVLTTLDNGWTTYDAIQNGQTGKAIANGGETIIAGIGTYLLCVPGGQIAGGAILLMVGALDMIEYFAGDGIFEPDPNRDYDAEIRGYELETDFNLFK